MKTAFAAARKKRVGQIVLAVPTIVFLALALHGISSDYKHIRLEKRRLEARTAVAEGAIVELHDAWHSSIRSPKKTVVFTAASGDMRV